MKELKNIITEGIFSVTDEESQKDAALIVQTTYWLRECHNKSQSLKVSMIKKNGEKYVAVYIGNNNINILKKAPIDNIALIPDSKSSIEIGIIPRSDFHDVNEAIEYTAKLLENSDVYRINKLTINDEIGGSGELNLSPLCHIAIKKLIIDLGEGIHIKYLPYVWDVDNITINLSDNPNSNMLIINKPSGTKEITIK